ncbi:hypothetical protein [Leptospira sarikeiensis]|uniref:Uncharacterized protein n=1 Tax=Leptospira sarikeiensis TaxID=2484943 RepID=A0A4R9KHA3_9LEPT|nr:hypothetical protein [Leptospira sarikeiensis]TGL65790.1 hypothetical protein EHQ64_00515 [Leptospira sarikeiensis]
MNRPNLIHKIARGILFFFFSASILFHISVLSGLVPYSIVWGGRVHDPESMVLLETLSLVLNSIFLIILLGEANLIRLPIPMVGIRGLLWIMVLIFSLNTVGNIYSENVTEQIVFTPVTIIIALCCLVLASGKRHTV